MGTLTWRTGLSRPASGASRRRRRCVLYPRGSSKASSNEWRSISSSSVWIALTCNLEIPRPRCDADLAMLSERRKQVVRRKRCHFPKRVPERGIELANEAVWRGSVEQRDPRYAGIRAHENGLRAGQIAPMRPGRVVLNRANVPTTCVKAGAIGTCRSAVAGHLRDELRAEDVRRAGAAIQ